MTPKLTTARTPALLLVAAALAGAALTPDRADGQLDCNFEPRAGVAFALGQLGELRESPGGTLRLGFGCPLFGPLDGAFEAGGQLFGNDSGDDLALLQFLAFAELPVMGSLNRRPGHRLALRFGVGWTATTDLVGGEALPPPVSNDLDELNLESSGVTLAPGVRWEAAVSSRTTAFVNVEWHRIFLNRTVVEDGKLTGEPTDAVSTLVTSLGVSLFH